MSETLSVIFDGEVFRPEIPLKLKPNTRYQITVQSELEPDNSLSNLNSLRQNYQFEDEKQVREFLTRNFPLTEFLLNAVSSIKHYLPEARLALRWELSEETGDEDNLILTIHTQGKKTEVRSKFNKLKSEWWFKEAEDFLDKISLEIEHPEFSTSQAVADLGTLIGSVEAPADWSIEHDHYLYGTPKRNQSQSNA